jgi:HEAT repeat protein
LALVKGELSEMNAEFKLLISKFPVPADDGKLVNPNGQEMAQAIEQLVKLGRAAVVELVDMLVDPIQATDTQVRHALHALATHVAGPGNDEPRRDIAQALGSTLDGDRPRETKGFVIRQLQVCGGNEATEALGRLLVDEGLCENAAQALLAIGGTASQFRQALPQANGKAARLTIVQALGVLRDAEAAIVLREAARDDDRELRLAAISALANIGQASDVDLLVSASQAKGFERVQATKSCLLLAEKLLAAGQKQPAAKLYQHLRDTSDDSEAYMRQAAERGLAAAR